MSDLEDQYEEDTFENKPEGLDPQTLVGLRLIPWDVKCMLSPDVNVFGLVETGSLCGKYAKFTPKGSYSDGVNRAPLLGLVGKIVYQLHGRIILEIDSEIMKYVNPKSEGRGYLGWLEPDEYKFVEIYMPNVNTIN